MMIPTVELRAIIKYSKSGAINEKVLYDIIKTFFDRSAFVFFGGQNNINLFAIRTKKSTVLDDFNDWIGVCYVDSNGKNNCFMIEGTVDPGHSYLKKPMNEFGCGALVEGQYRSVWKMGWYAGRAALIQVGNFSIYRDNDKDNIYHYNVESIIKSNPADGFFLHEHYQALDIATCIVNSSAGCVVPKSRRMKEELFDRLDLQISSGLGNLFTFTLFKEI